MHSVKNNFKIEYHQTKRLQKPVCKTNLFLFVYWRNYIGSDVLLIVSFLT